MSWTSCSLPTAGASCDNRDPDNDPDLDKSTGIAYNIINQPTIPIKANPSKGGDAKPRVYVSRWQIQLTGQPGC